MAKYEKTERLEKVPMEYLWEGLVLSDNLYNYNGSVLLVPSGEVITKSKLDKLINFSDGNNYITTFRGSYEYIMKGKDRPAEIQQKMLENRTGYTELRKGIDHVLQMSKNAMFVNHAEVEGMMEKVYGRMVSVDAGEIFQCITVPRPVDEALQRHSLNVALLNGIMGQWLGLDEKDIRIDVMRASGNGGQCVNTTDSAVRLTHYPTGIVIYSQTEKSQLQNKEKAFRLLRSKLYELELEKQHSAEAEARRSQIGTGDRSEKIRTYNFPQGRVTDHRIKLTLHKLDSIMNGDLDEVIDSLIAADQAAKLASMNEAV